jgi:hypothetical protein
MSTCAYREIVSDNQLKHCIKRSAVSYATELDNNLVVLSMDNGYHVTVNVPFRDIVYWLKQEVEP